MSEVQDIGVFCASLDRRGGFLFEQYVFDFRILEVEMVFMLCLQEKKFQYNFWDFKLEYICFFVEEN